MLKTTKISILQVDLEAILSNGFISEVPGQDLYIIGELAAQEREVDSNYVYHVNFYKTQIKKYPIKTYCICSLDELLSIITDSTNTPMLEKLKDYDQDYIEDVKNSLSYMQKDELEKIVLITCAHYKRISHNHPIFHLAQIKKNLNGFIYGSWIDGEGVIGSSPEPLFIKEKNIYRTVALAGTIATTTEDYSNTILSDQKELNEHNLVISDIKNKLENIASEIKINKTQVYNFGPIAHLKTDIVFKTIKDQFEIIKSLAPTSALGGYPKDIWQNISREMKYYTHEKENREFGGVFGLNIDNHNYSLVKIRNISWTKDQAYIHSGSGVVKESIPEKELLEVQNKRKAIEDLFI